MNDTQNDNRLYFDFGNEVHKYTAEMLKMADDKAKAVFGVSGALLIYSFNKAVPTCVSLFDKQGIGSDILFLLKLVSMAFLLISGILSLHVLYPRLAGSTQGLIFFGSILSHEDADTYSEKIMTMKKDELITQVHKHIYEISHIAEKKFAILQHSFQSGMIGFFLMLIYLYSIYMVS